MQPLLDIHKLQLEFSSPQGPIHAVRGVSLHLQQGEMLALVGESGCGKSVLCKSILGLVPHTGKITGGQILFEGRNIVSATPRDMDKIRGGRIAAVFQDPYATLDPTWCVGAQICESISVHCKIPKAEARSEAIALLRRVGIQNPKQRYGDRPDQFSGGQRQRIAIAIALACRPSLLIADEITTALDAISAAEILSLLITIQKQIGMAILLVTHDLASAFLADRVAVMYAGKIVETGTAQEIACDARHPYTWALISALPSLTEHASPLICLSGAPPDLRHPPIGDAFAPRNPYAMKIDFEREPPEFSITATHRAATWLCHPEAPAVERPAVISQRQFYELFRTRQSSYQT